jgi:hypothetical protein
VGERRETITDATGRVIRVRDLDDRGERFPIIQGAPASCAGIGVFTEVFKTESMERARRGHLTYSIDVHLNDSRTWSNLYLEVNVIGYIAGGPPSVVQYTTIDVNILGEFEWLEPDSFSNIGIEVRQNLDGVVDGQTNGIDWLRLNVQGAYWR